MQKVRVGITIGDINGISPEVIIKSVYPQTMLDACTPVIYGSSKVVSYHKNIVQSEDFAYQSLQTAERLNPRKVNVINCWEESVNINLGRPTEESGKYAYIALDRAVRDLKDGHIDVLVTGPVNKHALRLANFPAVGHTDYLEDQFSGKSLMLMVSDVMKIGLVTDHIPVSQIAQQISKETLRKKLDLFIKCLQMDFGHERPTIAVLGLNPHASDHGTIGTEDDEIVSVAILEHKKGGHIVMGPYSADGFFGSGAYKKFDGILAMYHDQGLIPFKTISFGYGVNFTAGLSIVRTSPDHGTAYDLAGKNESDPTSMRHAIYAAIDTFKRRQEYHELRENPIKKQPKQSESLESVANPDGYRDDR
jgi:4-phospho-D-threonate 3-dehydrogenase / 4-phospho-D-erythronate 3-dehydrogenase